MYVCMYVCMYVYHMCVYVQVKKRIINEHLLPLLTYADIC